MEKWFILGLLAVFLFGLGSFLGKFASNSDISPKIGKLYPHSKKTQGTGSHPLGCFTI